MVLRSHVTKAKLKGAKINLKVNFRIFNLFLCLIFYFCLCVRVRVLCFSSRVLGGAVAAMVGGLTRERKEWPKSSEASPRCRE